jgi:16S rRNA (cytosine1402-N4)-methyltransferase
MNKPPHISILENEMASVFSSSKLTVYVDATVGAGGHAKRILEEHPEITCFIGLDQDPEALAIAKERLLPWKDKVHLVHSNFANLDRQLQKLHVKSVDGFFLTWECHQCN